jgi:HEAT repeat protein
MKSLYLVTALCLCVQVTFASEPVTTVITDELLANITLASETNFSTCFASGVQQLVNTQDDSVRKQSIARLAALLAKQETTLYGKYALLRMLTPYADQLDAEVVAACLNEPLTRAQAMRILDAKGDKRGALTTITPLPENDCVKAFRDIQKNPKSFSTYIVSPDKKIREVAISCAGDLPTPDLLESYQKVSDSAPKLLILTALSTRKDKQCVPLFKQEAGNTDEAFACAGLSGMASLATLEDVPFLLTALDRSPAVSLAARNVLISLEDPKTEETLLAAKIKRETLLDIIGDRDTPQAFDRLLPYIRKTESGEVRAAAWRNLRKVVNEAHVPTLIALLQEAHEDDINPAEQTLMSALKEMNNAKRNELVLDTWQKATSKTAKGVTFSMMQRFKDASFEPELLKLIASENDLTQEALRTLCSYNPPSKTALLALLAYTQDEKKQQGIAARLFLANGADTFALLQSAFESPQSAVAKKLYLHLYDKQFEGLKSQPKSRREKGVPKAVLDTIQKTATEIK